MVATYYNLNRTGVRVKLVIQTTKYESTMYIGLENV